MSDAALRFFRSGRARIGILVLAPVLFFSVTAELWSGSEPLAFRRDGAWRLPVLKKVTAASLGIEDALVVDWRELEEKDAEEGRGSFYLFPVNRWDPYEQGAEPLRGPSSAHWFGTDSLGRDVAARLLYGLRVSLSYGVLFWVFTFLIGIAIGAVQGYFAGRLDFATERLKELSEIVPFLSAVILVNGLTQSGSFGVTLLVVVVLSWVPISAQVRAQVLSLRKREFVDAARAIGGRTPRVLFRHVLPNALTPVLALSPFAISGGIALLAVLDYLGFGLQPPTPSLGELLAQGRSYVATAPWLLLAPSLALAAVLLAINLLGEALRRALDPKAR